VRGRSSKQTGKRYYEIAQIVAKHRWPDAICAFAHPSRNQAHRKRCNRRGQNDAGMKLRIHGDKPVGPGEEYGTDDESPAELRVGQSPRSPENTVQRRLIHAPEDEFLGETGHDQEEGPALSGQFLARPKNKENCGHRQGHEQSHHRRLEPTWPEA